MMDSEFSYGLDLYRVRYGDGEVTSLLAQSPDQARGLAETARPGSVVVDTALVPSRP
jgi:hypothetical protein